MKNAKGMRELTTKKESERRPRSLATHLGSLENFVGEEAPEARVGPRNPVGTQTVSTPQILWARCRDAVCRCPLGRAYGVRRPERP